MEITYLGHSSFKLKGKVATVVTDPYDEKVGKYPKDTQADIVTVSHDHSDHNQTSKLLGTPFVIAGPGEYEVKGVSVIGVHTFHDDQSGAARGINTVYVIEMDELRLVHLGDLGHKLTEENLAEIGSVDIVFIPVGGEYTIDAKIAAEVVKQVDPWIAVPMHYQQEGLEAGTFGKLVGVDAFLKEMAKEGVVPAPKLTMSVDKLPTELQIVVLERK